MKKLLILLMICSVQHVIGQNPMESLKVKLEKEYVFEAVDEFIQLARELPVKVPIGEKDSADWVEARTQCTELYLLWYDGMSDLGYKIGTKSLFDAYEGTPDTVETNEQIQARIFSNTKVKYKKQAVAALLEAEQRLKLFVKKSYDNKRRQMFNVELIQFGQPYEKLTKQIMNQVLARELSFLIYENKIGKRKEKEEALVDLKSQ